VCVCARAHVCVCASVCVCVCACVRVHIHMCSNMICITQTTAPHQRLQHDATPCNRLQHTRDAPILRLVSKLLHVLLVALLTRTSMCDVDHSYARSNIVYIQHTRDAPVLVTLQHTATHCNILQHTRDAPVVVTLKYTAIHCNTLQYIATRCSTLQHIRGAPILSLSVLLLHVLFIARFHV